MVADCLDGRFDVLQHGDKPQSMFPIVNVPHIRYTIEFLLMNQVHDIVIAAKKSNQA